jgi:hypothetical protein
MLYQGYKNWVRVYEPYIIELYNIFIEEVEKEELNYEDFYTEEFYEKFKKQIYNSSSKYISSFI